MLSPAVVNRMFTLLLIGLMFTPLSAQNQGLPLHAFLRDLLKADSQTWVLTKQFDPYNGGHTMRLAQEKEQLLLISSEGNFSEKIQPEKRSGKWMIDMEAKTIQLVYTRIDGRMMEQPLEGPHLKVKEYTGEVLVLSRQGRHGWVDMHYQLKN